MSNQENSTKEPVINDYRGDLVGVLRTLFKRKWLVVSGIVLFTLLSLLLSFILPKVYRSEGFFQFSDPSKEQSDPFFSVASQLLESSKLAVLSQLKDLGMLNVLKNLNIEFDRSENFFVITLQDFKKYSSSFNNYQRFLEFVKQGNYLDKTELKNLKKRIKNSSQLSKRTREVYALSRDDMKNVGQTLLQEKNYVVGVELEMEAAQPGTARRFLSAFGEFIRFRIFYEKLNEYITLHTNEFKTLTRKYDNYILNNNAVLAELLKKREKLRTLYKKYPAFSKIEKNQVISLEDTGERYLSLVAQIIGIETRILDLEQLVEHFKFEKRKNELFSGFFDELKKMPDKKFSSGEQVLKEIDALKDAFFKEKDPGNPGTQAVLNSIAIDRERFNTLFYKTLRFVSGPSLPEVPQWPRKSIFVIFGFFIGTLLFFSIALVLEFWNKHKKLITADK